MEFIIAAGVWFWLYAAVVALLLVVSVANECDFCGAFLVVGGVFAAHWLFGLPLTWLPRSPWVWAAIAIVYLPAGVAWSFFKFYVACKKQVQEITKSKQTWIDIWKRDTPAITDDELAKKWAARVDDYALTASDMKSEIITWIACWPLSIVCYVVGDLLHDLLSKIYEQFSGLYERIATRISDAAKQ